MSTPMPFEILGRCSAQRQRIQASLPHLFNWILRFFPGRLAPDIQTSEPLLGKRKCDLIDRSSTQEPSRKRARLTETNLRKLHTEMGGSKHRSSGWSESTSKSISTTTSGFADRAFSNGVLNPRYSQPASNIHTLRETVNRSRDTASPSESEYRAYVDDHANIDGEDTVVHEFPLLKTVRSADYGRSYNQAFTDLPSEVGFNNGLSAAQPDYIEGLRLQAFRPLDVRTQIPGAVPRPGPGAITLPHFAGEFKAPGKDMHVAELQAAYDGASMVYMRTQATEFLEIPDPPNHAAITSFVTDGSFVRTYAHHSDSVDGKVRYHQTRIESTDITNSYDDYKKGRRQLRNLQDYARRASHHLKDQLKLKDRLDDDEAASSQLVSEYNNFAATAVGITEYIKSDAPYASTHTSTSQHNERDPTAHESSSTAEYHANGPPYSSIPTARHEVHYVTNHPSFNTSKHNNNDASYSSTDAPTVQHHEDYAGLYPKSTTAKQNADEAHYPLADTPTAQYGGYLAWQPNVHTGESVARNEDFSPCQEVGVILARTNSYDVDYASHSTQGFATSVGQTECGTDHTLQPCHFADGSNDSLPPERQPENVDQPYVHHSKQQTPPVTPPKSPVSSSKPQKQRRRRRRCQ